MDCTDACRRPSPTQCHCPTCHRTFGGARGFDDHRFHGTCRDPSVRGYVEVDGIWRQPGGSAVWQKFRDAPSAPRIAPQAAEQPPRVPRLGGGRLR